MSRRNDKKKKTEEEDVVDRPVFFFYARTGGTESYKQLFNTRVRCNVLLDYVRADMRETLGSKVSLGIHEANEQLARVLVRQEEKKRIDDEKKALEEKQALDNTEATTQETEDSARADKRKSRGGLMSSRQATSSRQSKRATMSRGDLSQNAKEAEAEVDPLVAEKTKLEQMLIRLQEGLDLLESADVIDFVDAQGVAMNLRDMPREYAETVLRPAATYNIAVVRTQPDGVTTLTPIEISS